MEIVNLKYQIWSGTTKEGLVFKGEAQRVTFFWEIGAQ